MKEQHLRKILLGAIMEYSNSWDIQKAIDYGIELHRANTGTMGTDSESITERKEEIFRAQDNRIDTRSFVTDEDYFTDERKIEEG